ncbi:ASCH domain-containing protein [Streptomyces sp. S063]|uniref:ASCH domain-containing protein n=1 Tax=Streptomyces sp. S063 TaxID=2005885 RepID=UPI001F2FB772|nr:ASCH domain-containing protein [Streptomyces sp. S063]
MNTPERALLLSLHPRFATAILNGEKTVELRRQRVAVPPGTPVIIYATSPTMALTAPPASPAWTPPLPPRSGAATAVTAASVKPNT